MTLSNSVHASGPGTSVHRRRRANAAGRWPTPRRELAHGTSRARVTYGQDLTSRVHTQESQPAHYSASFRGERAASSSRACLSRRLRPRSWVMNAHGPEDEVVAARRLSYFFFGVNRNETGASLEMKSCLCCVPARIPPLLEVGVHQNTKTY